jgi:hypothetical protein
LPALRSTGVSPLLRGVEIGLAHGFFLIGPFIKLGPLRNVEGVAEVVGSINGAALVLILSVCLTIYGQTMFQSDDEQVGTCWAGSVGQARALTLELCLSTHSWSPEYLGCRQPKCQTWNEPTGLAHTYGAHTGS